MPISISHKLIFVHVSKTGGTSIKDALSTAGILKRDRTHLWGRIPQDQEHIYKVRWWQHLRAWQIRDMLPAGQWDDFFKFAFVRNPWERVVSEYFYVRKASTEKPNSNHYGRTYPDTFLDWFAGRTPLVQSEFVCDPVGGEILMDFVGRFENLAGDFAQVCTRIGLPNLTLPHKLKTEHASYRDYFDAEAREKVATVCAADIDNFGYRF